MPGIDRPARQIADPHPVPPPFPTLAIAPPAVSVDAARSRYSHRAYVVAFGPCDAFTGTGKYAGCMYVIAQRLGPPPNSADSARLHASARGESSASSSGTRIAVGMGSGFGGRGGGRWGLRGRLGSSVSVMTSAGALGTLLGSGQKV